MLFLACVIRFGSWGRHFKIAKYSPFVYAENPVVKLAFVPIIDQYRQVSFTIFRTSYFDRILDI